MGQEFINYMSELSLEDFDFQFRERFMNQLNLKK